MGASLLSKEYLEAVSVLSEDTMNRACHLLMKAYDSDADIADAESSANTNSKEDRTEKKPKTAIGDDDDKGTISVEDQLLEMYHNCQEALAVIRKHQPVGAA